MTRETRHNTEPKSKHSRSHRHHQRRHGHEADYYSDGERSTVSDAQVRTSDEASQDPVPGVFTWSEPVLDTHSSGRFQYQARLTRDGYQWTISGSDSGTNPQYLSATSAHEMLHPLSAAATTYSIGPYVAHQPIQNNLQYYGPLNTSASPAVPPDNGGSGNFTSKEYYEEEKTRGDRSAPRQNKSFDDYRNEKRGEQRHCHIHSHHRDHSSHRRRHHRSKSHGDSTRQKHKGQGHSQGDSHDKVSDWLYNYEYEN
ncbi:hypothetical protein F5Y12DRAFT_454416 [Xylaria sp. FL1777]|nr:hypothetical protein F5Y12DRAFT_454416 [Xylaria sp. FL1777]